MVKIISINGEVAKEIQLPEVFNEEFRPDLIQRAFLAKKSSKYQPKGVDPEAGFRTTAEYVGRRGGGRVTICRGISRLPRIKIGKYGWGEVRRVPQARKGHAAHAPTSEKILKENINKKENKKAIRSAIAATANKEIVLKRYKSIKNLNLELPIIIENSLEDLKKAKDLEKIFEKLGLTPLLERSRKRKIVGGKAKMRGRKYKEKKGALIVVSKKCDALKTARNLPGVDVCLAKDLNCVLLAPGGHPGRITIYTEGALDEIERVFGA